MYENVPVPNSVPENMEKPFACRAPCNPHILDSDDRLPSFTENWPAKGPVTPRKMANAGFYYLGDSNRVICFYCDEGLKNWEPNDNP